MIKDGKPGVRAAADARFPYTRTGDLPCERSADQCGYDHEGRSVPDMVKAAVSSMLFRLRMLCLYFNQNVPPFLPEFGKQ